MVGAELDMPVMVGVGRGDVDKVQVGVAEHLLVAAEGLVHPVGLGKSLGPGQVPRSHGVEFHLRMSVLIEQTDGVGHDAGNLPGAQNSHFHCIYLP